MNGGLWNWRAMGAQKSIHAGKGSIYDSWNTHFLFVWICECLCVFICFYLWVLDFSAKVDLNVDFTHKLCAALMLQPFRFWPICVILRPIWQDSKHRPPVRGGYMNFWLLSHWIFFSWIGILVVHSHLLLGGGYFLIHFKFDIRL